jgi:hypothetical protein
MLMAKKQVATLINIVSTKLSQLKSAWTGRSSTQALV